MMFQIQQIPASFPLYYRLKETPYGISTEFGTQKLISTTRKYWLFGPKSSEEYLGGVTKTYYGSYNNPEDNNWDECLKDFCIEIFTSSDLK